MPGTFQVSGLMSGLDTKNIISQLLQIEQRPIVDLQASEGKVRSLIDVVRDINSKLMTLRDRTSALMLSANVLAKTFKLETVGGATANIGVTTTADAVLGSFKVWVDRLATGTTTASSAPIGQAIDPAVVLTSAGFLATPTSGTFTINGVQISVDATTDKLNDVISRINSSGAGVTASLVADGNGRLNLLQLSSNGTIQLGTAGDTSNFLQITRLQTATQAPLAAATLTGTAVSSGKIKNVSFTLNSTQLPGGVTVNLDQNNASYSSQQNAEYIRDQITAQAGGLGITASTVDLGGGNFAVRVVQNQIGKDYSVTLGSLTGADAGKTGLSNTTVSGTDGLVSVGPVGVVQTTAKLQSARLATALTAQTGQFSVNGVSFTYDAVNDSLADIITRINNSSANVTATYNTTTDKIELTSRTTGNLAVSFADQTGNFLAATGLLGAAQTLGQNALYRIDTLNGGLQQSSTSNKLTSVLPGVTIDLKAVSTDPVTVTVTQDTATTAKTVQDFIDAFNAVVDLVRKQTAYDSKTKSSGPLLGDSFTQGIETQLRSIALRQVSGLTGAFQSLADIGISSGKVGSATGTTNHLVLDQTKLANALSADPGAVATLLGMSGTGPNGMAQQLKSYLVALTDPGGLMDAKIDSADDRITRIEREIERVQVRVALKRQMLEAKFSRLETALAQLQSQGTQLGAQINRMMASGS